MARRHDWDAKETSAERQKRGGREKHAGWVDGSGNKVNRGRGMPDEKFQPSLSEDNIKRNGIQREKGEEEEGGTREGKIVIVKQSQKTARACKQ